MCIQRGMALPHFQLRYVLGASSRAEIFYASQGGIKLLNPITKKTSVFVDSRKFMEHNAVVSCLDVNCGILMGGTMHGQYCLRSLESDSEDFFEGRITHDTRSFINHISLYKPRHSNKPCAAISGNDGYLRVMDVETQRFTLAKAYEHALNCSALSPDGRLRMCVGDHPNVIVTRADTGEVLQELNGHRDNSFACDWSDDGYTVATASQDRSIKIWDARYWRDANGNSKPVHTLLTRMSGARSLKFSPAGSGPKVLVATESSDFINIIDAKTYEQKQMFDVFGEIGGITFTNDDQDLSVLCTDATRGGLIQLERCGPGIEFDSDELGVDEGQGSPSGAYTASVARRMPRYRRGLVMPF